MPIYLYQCADCDTIHEVLQKFSDPPLTACPGCGSEGVQKLFSPEIGFSFKGSGFYITDYTHHRNRKAEKKTAAAPTNVASAND
ncbi:MAG: hypothetical protein ALAOOOJD_03296 [bacterium]|nr:hypothetical protein [bacterium]